MSRDDSFDVAVTGLSARFPGPSDLAGWWAAIRAGEVLTTRRSADELIAAGVPEALVADPDYVPVCGYLEDADRFDNTLFGLSPRDAELTDPQHRLMLEAAWSALEDAGRDPYDDSVRTGVYASSSTSAYQRRILMGGRLPHDSHDRLEVGTSQDYMATRIAYKLGLRGPAISVQTACSSSLVAVHTAVQALLNGECDQAVVVAASVGFPQEGHLRVPGGIMSAGGACRPFDAGADGTVAGAGVAAVVLRRLADSRADGMRPHGIILGTAVNNDGSAKAGYNAPSTKGQEAVIRAALRAADVRADWLGYLEAHATGTYVGDPIEWTAMCAALAGVPDGQVAVGALKANIGHLDAASGLASLVKALHVVKDGVVPPLAGFTELNPMLTAAGSPLAIPTEQAQWSGPTPRRAGISSFGIGGTNAHVVIEAPPAAAPPSAAPTRDTVVVLSAADPAAVKRAASRLADRLTDTDSLTDVAHTLLRGRAGLPHRLAVVGPTPAEIAKRLRTPAKQVLGVRPATGPAPLVFLLPGQGAQRPGMGLPWRAHLPGFADAVAECLAELPADLAAEVESALFDPDLPRDRVERTELTQPALFVLEYAAAQALRGLGLVPAAVAGHSLGEITSACLAGTLTRADALRLVTARGQLMQRCPGGTMLAVGCAEHEAVKLLNDAADTLGASELEIAAVNTADSCVVAGPTAVIETFAAWLGDRVFHRALATGHAFHCALMEPAITGLEAELDRLTAAAPTIPFLANATGTLIDPGAAVDPGMFAESARRTVRFADGMAALAARFPGAVTVEVGPGRALSEMAEAEGLTAVTMAPGRGGRAEPLSGLAALWTLGQPVDLAVINGAGRRTRVPTYPFQGPKWIAPEAVTHAAKPTTAVAEPAQPDTPQVLVTAMWADQLGYADLTADADFFAFGGDSLALIRLVRSLAKELDITIPIREFATARTLGAQIALVDALVAQEGDPI